MRGSLEKEPLRSLTSGLEEQFGVEVAGPGLLAIRTTWKAPRGRILVVNLADREREKWREIVPEGADAIAGFAVVGGRLFVDYLHDVRLVIASFSLDGKRLADVPLPGPVSGRMAGDWD